MIRFFITDVILFIFQINLKTSTYLATQTFTRLVGGVENPQIVTSKEVITQVVVTEVPSVSRAKIETTPAFSTLVTKTYLTTFTYYNTNEDGHVQTETVVSSDVVIVTDIEATASLPVVSLTKPLNLDSEAIPFEIFATKTYFTTSTYLTTILEGGKTVTSSHIEVTSNVRTEPITSAINTDDILLRGSTIYAGENVNNPFEEISYLSLGDDVYREFRTLFATYTHYTTLHNGRVKSSEVTKTEILTSTITTTSVPVSLLIQPDEILTISQTIKDQPQLTSHIFDNFFNVQLDPSYTESTTKKHPLKTTGSITKTGINKESSDLKATVHVEEGIKTDTSVVHDSTTKATLLIQPTLEELSDKITSEFELVETDSLFPSILASSQLSLVETTTSPSFEVEIFSEAPTSRVSTLDHSTVLRGEDHVETTLSSGDKIIIVTQPNGEELHLPHVKITSSPTLFPATAEIEPAASISLPFPGEDKPTLPVRGEDEATLPVRGEDQPILPVRVSNVENNSGGTSIQTETNKDKVPENEGSSFGIGLSPMLTAVAGLIGNTFVGKLAGEAGVKRTDSIMPKNAIVAAENEPILIPVGGVGVSLSDHRDSTIEPEHGFIPLHKSELIKPVPSLTFSKSLSDVDVESAKISEPRFPISMEKFGPSFQPPVETESGFTAMIKDINPTKISVISGEETIFFGGFESVSLPPPGQPTASEIRPQDFISEHHLPIYLDQENGNKQSHLLQSQSETQDILVAQKDLKGSGLLNFENIYPKNTGSIDEEEFVFSDKYDDSFLEATVGIGDAPKKTNKFPLEGGEQDQEISVRKGSSTGKDDATTIFDSLFASINARNSGGGSRRSDSNIKNQQDNETEYLVSPENSPVVTSTSTHYQTENDSLSPAKEVVKTTPLRTIVPKIIDPSIPHTTLQSSSKVNREGLSPENYEKTKLQTTTIGSPTLYNKTYDDSELYRNAVNFSDTLPESEFENLDYEAENKSSQFLEDNSPDQVLRYHKTTICTPECKINEMCKVFRQEHVCICKPGYSRRTPGDKCASKFNVNYSLV